MLRLGVNIDHMATLRNARGGLHPCPIRAALLAHESGAHSITAHLREDRRHIKDSDIERLKNEVPLPLNLEMAATDEMLAIALKIKPHAVCLVPEKRTELTTEGGLDVASHQTTLTPYIKKLQDNGSRVSLFIDANKKQVEAAKNSGARAIELHTGTYAENYHSSLRAQRSNPESWIATSAMPPRNDNLQLLQQSATLANNLGLEVHAGHGLNYENTAAIAAIPEIVELNIGHFLIGEAVFIGLKPAITKMLDIMNKARGNL